MVLKLVFPEPLLHPKVREKLIEAIADTIADTAAENWTHDDVRQNEYHIQLVGFAAIRQRCPDDESLLREYVEELTYEFQCLDEEEVRAIGFAPETFPEIQDYKKLAEYLTTKLLEEALTDASS